ncbi:Hypothetical protein PHPALM_20093 [Phytophthora palmivora]|uniref:Uncharacterized protein n=1 Tax=Phytophthora palmivora TaxID=4796 RepID=A0A2P4XFQ0_9STRA|nr:Hypothetical protein PHPALM_20093 [Phytophthora palmivora]
MLGWFERNACCTQVEFVSPDATAICQPMDVSVMKLFNNHITDLYTQCHIDNQFPTTTGEKRSLMSRIVAKLEKPLLQVL